MYADSRSLTSGATPATSFPGSITVVDITHHSPTPPNDLHIPTKVLLGEVEGAKHGVELVDDVAGAANARPRVKRRPALRQDRDLAARPERDRRQLGDRVDL